MRFLTVFMLIASLYNPLSDISFAPPAPPSPWFIEQIELETPDLPSGVSIVVIESDHGQERIEIKNNSNIIVYVAGTPHHDTGFDEISVKFPSGTGPMYKVVDGKAYKWDFELTDSEPSYYYAWFPNDRYEGGKNAIWLYAHGDQIGSARGKIADIVQKNQFGGDRPNDVGIPKSQEASFPIIYGSEEINIPLTISYVLNDDYYPYKPSVYLGPDILCLLLVLVIAILALAAWGIVSTYNRYKLQKREYLDKKNKHLSKK